MSKARQSTRKRYRKPRADYQAGGRVNARRGGRQFDELDAIMTGRGGKKIPSQTKQTETKNTPPPDEQVGGVESGAATPQAQTATPAMLPETVTQKNPFKKISFRVRIHMSFK